MQPSAAPASHNLDVSSEAEADTALVAAVLSRGDEARFRVLYRRHTPALFRLALRLSGGASADAEDAVQETWIRAGRRLASFRGDSAFRTWLSGILVNRCRETRRERARETDAAVDDEPCTAPPAAERIDLERALAALAPGYREVLVLHDVEGYTHEEIAGLLGVDAGTSKSQLSRARRAMRAALTSRPELP
jgi:RNA polymerase sigma-70 factor (ECF subfamily)